MSIYKLYDIRFERELYRYEDMNGKNEKNKIHGRRILPESIMSFTTLLILIFVEEVFLMLVAAIDILPGKYMGALVALIIIVDVIALAAFAGGRNERLRRADGIAMTAVVVIGMGLCSYYLCNTYDTFSKISGEIVQVETFYVVAAKDGSYEAEEDIEKTTVYITDKETRTYKEAKGKLITEYDVQYKDAGDLSAAGHKLIDKYGRTQDNVIFVSRNNYELLCESIDDFKKKTKVIHRIPVQVKSNNQSKKVNVTEDSFNIYITGIDVFGDIDQVSRSDVNMIMTVNPKTREILLTSIPRDMYVPLHSFGALDKLTHSGIYGVDETINTVEDWMGIGINYYVRINFSMLVRIVNAIGGIDVDSEYAFKSAVSDYTYKKGINHLDGKAALYFARERKAFKAEDAQRVKNQQKVLKAMIKKVTGSAVLLTKYTDILNAVEGTMQTNLSDRDITSLVRMQLDKLGKWDIKTISVKGKGAYEYTYSMGMRELYVAIPVEKTVDRAVEEINSVMYPADDE